VLHTVSFVLLPLSTQLRRSGAFGSPLAASCIAPVLWGQNHYSEAGLDFFPDQRLNALAV
jgi:hypothetical protein